MCRCSRSFDLITSRGTSDIDRRSFNAISASQTTNAAAANSSLLFLSFPPFFLLSSLFESFIHSLLLSVIEDAINLTMQVGFTATRPLPLFYVLYLVFAQFLLSANKEQLTSITTVLHYRRRITLFRHRINGYKIDSFLSHSLQRLKRVYLSALFSNQGKLFTFSSQHRNT